VEVVAQPLRLRAIDLDITPKSIDTYKNRIGEKLGFTHRTDYVRFAAILGLMGDRPSRRAIGLAG
jgi:DNA-binding CsgD family transcriptional regulator